MKKRLLEFEEICVDHKLFSDAGPGNLLRPSKTVMMASVQFFLWHTFRNLGKIHSVAASKTSIYYFPFSLEGSC
jgi:hypothetical protein